MALTNAQVQFVRTMTSYVKKYNSQYQINDNCVLAIVAQSCNESAWGASKLSADYYNFWGMKCGSSWTGASVNFETWEETPSGDIKVSSDFRAYSSFEDGVIGYFEFIQYPRYQNLKQCTTTQEYLETIKNIYISEAITSIGNNFFNGMKSVIELAIQERVTRIGENAISLRENLVKSLSNIMGIELDQEANNNISKYKSNQSGFISKPESKTKVIVLPTNEEYMILKDTYNLSKQLKEKKYQKVLKR
jgi:hypothetical protein